MLVDRTWQWSSLLGMKVNLPSRLMSEMLLEKFSSMAHQFSTPNINDKTRLVKFWLLAMTKNKIYEVRILCHASEIRSTPSNNIQDSV
ncbi:hypothetical protein Peur_046703 [Populus x canadensis]